MKEPAFYTQDGEAIYICHYTYSCVKESDVVWVKDGIYPGQPAVIVPAIPGYEKYKKLSDRAFHEMDANCNTCKFLTREKHEKTPQGFLYGYCSKPGFIPNNLPYALRDETGLMMFHPSDFMGMTCWKGRWDESE